MKISKDAVLILQPILGQMFETLLPELLDEVSEFSTDILQRLSNLISSGKRLDGEGYLLGLYSIVMYQADSIDTLEIAISILESQIVDIYKRLGEETKNDN